MTPYDELPVLADGRRHAWHEFAGDERGSLSRVTSEVVRVATAEVGTGERIALSVPLGTFQPALSGNRSDLRHTVTRNRNGGDDKLDNFYLQESSQWDGFAHIRYREFGFFGGREVDDLNAGAIGIDRMAPTGIITRGVLVDVPRHWAATGRTWSPTETIAITPADVDATLAAQGTAVRDGDVLLVRTGWVGWYLGLGEPARKELGGALAVAGLPTPGLCQGEAFPRWLWNHGVAAVAADNPALEAIPVPKGSGFLHRYLLPLLGIPIGELWALDGLAAACERYERWSFLLVSVPLNLPQGVGSPSNAVAVLSGKSMSVAVNIRQQLRHLAQNSGERPFLVTGDETLTYAELESQCLRFATALDAAGIAPGARVAALLPNGVEWLVAYLGTAASGRIFVGLNTWFTGKDLAYVLGQCGAELLVLTGRFRSHDYDAALREALGGDAVSGGQVNSAALPALRGIIAVGATAAATSTWAEFLASGHHGEPRHQPAPADPALIVFTSGSTGLPKGVPLLQEALLRNGEYIGDRQHVAAGDRLWLSTPLFFSYGCANAVMVVLAHGCTLLLQDFFDPPAAAELLEGEVATVYYATTNMTYALREELAARPRRLALRTGTAIGTPAQIRAAADLVPGICNIYGMTETYGNCTVTDADDPLEVRLATQGQPLPGHVITIVDTETETELPPGELGEIRVAGLVTPGYWNDPERTAASVDGQGRLRTGDLGCLDASGRLVWESRLGDLIKTAGVNVSAAEVERVLEQDSRILQVYVVGVPDEVRGENIAACVQPADDLLTAQDVVEFAQARLASYKVPRLVELRPSGEFPLTSTGKVSRRDLARELARATA